MTESPRYPPERGKHLADDEGTTTIDLGRHTAIAAVPKPAPGPPGEWYENPAAEQHVRTRGKWMTICGAAITVLTSGMALVWRAGLGQDMPLAVLLPLQAAGLGSIALGALEHLSRPTRSAQRRILDRIDHLELALLDLVPLLDEDKQQAFYRGAAWQTRNEVTTGTENARPLNRYRTGDVVAFRQRNDR